MVIILPRVMKKWYLWAALLLVAGFWLLWYLGGREPAGTIILTAEESQSAATYYQRLLSRASNLRQITGDSITNDKALSTLIGQGGVIVYQKTDLKISKTENLETIRAYGENLARTLRPYAEPRDNESKIMLVALETNKPRDLAPLEQAQRMHGRVLDDLLILATPPSAVDLHLKLVNNLATQKRLTGNMLQVFSEPLLALESAQLQYQEAKRFFQLAGEVNQYFRSRGIIFTPAETLRIYLTI